MKSLTPGLLAVSATGLGLAWSAPAASFATLEKEYDSTIFPLLSRYCLDCHDEASNEGELDLEGFVDLAAVRRDSKTWQKIVYQLETGEMPPEKKSEKKNTPQPSPEEHATFLQWAKTYLRTEARAQAGDPGPVILRRLSNAEYTYTLRDLTGVPSLDPAREFPVDSAAGEGFTNTGGALVMSPALFEKYLEAGKEMARHLVLFPEGIRFSASTSRADHANELLNELRSTYLRATGGDGINFEYNDQVRSASPEGVGEGRVNLQPYFAALIRHRDTLRDDPERAGPIAHEAGLSSKYLGILAQTLLRPQRTGSFLLDHLRERLIQASPADAAGLAAGVRNWQDQLWRFNKVGHLGLIRKWQEPVTPLASHRDIRVKLAPGTNSIHLIVRHLGNGGKVQWQQPRIVRPGKNPIFLRDLEATATEVELLRGRSLARTADYLAAASELRGSGDEANLERVAAERSLHPGILAGWASYLGISGGRLKIGEPLNEKIPAVHDYDFVNGWTLKGVADYSLLGNSSDQAVRIPGDHRPHRIVAHPRPERWIAAGWMSPFTGQVKVTPHVQDAHGSCGNGVAWSVNLRRAGLTRILHSANLDQGQTARTETVSGLDVRKGDLLSIIIGARDNNHSCDLTEIDLTVEELDGNQRKWSLSGDCADDMLAGNPHSDHHGHPAVWHFYGGMNDSRPKESGVLPGSLLERWLREKDPARSHEIALRVQELLHHSPPAQTSESDRATRRHLTSLQGPLFSDLDFAELARQQQQNGRQDDRFDKDGNLIAPADSPLEFKLPPSLVTGAEFVTRGTIDPSGGEKTVVQLQGGPGPAPRQDTATLDPSLPLVVRSGPESLENMKRALDEYRNLFPAAMCYARIVPADEVVTLLLYHREDEHLERLMLDGNEMKKIDTLWERLRFVKREPHRLVTAYEQIWQFATQDSDPSRFEPMEPAIRKGAAEFDQQLLSAEKHHLEALTTLASTLYRRPLTDEELQAVPALYARLRTEKFSHEKACRLTLARLFSSAPFLYKTETPSLEPRQGPINNWEMATRLSYFLASSTPDIHLLTVASNETFSDEVLIRETRRMLGGDGTRRLAIHFGCQWLNIRDFDQHQEKNEKLYPEFEKLRGKMYEEAVRFFTDFFQNNRSILSLLNSDHTFADAELAKFYRLPAPTGGWQRVSGLRGLNRGGILGFASTLAKHSGASRTSPILRGNWISETLLGEKLPKPPKDVPTLPDQVPTGLTARELIQQHSSEPACAKCHARIDPYGFALEAFDTIGRSREGRDTSATLPDGTAIRGLDGLRTYLLEERGDTFVRYFCRKLLGYALGREVQLSDEPLLDELMIRLKGDDYRVRTVVETIVVSRQFREIRSAPE